MGIHCLLVKHLEQLRVQHSGNEVEGRVVVRDDGEDGGLALSHQVQLQLVVHGERGQGIQVELHEARGQGDLDGFQGLARAGLVVMIPFHGDVVRFPVLQFLEQHVQRRNKVLVLLLDGAVAEHVHDHVEIPLLRRGFIVEVEDQGQQEHLRGVVPEGLLGLGPLRRRIQKQICDQSDNVIVLAQIHKGVIAVASLHVEQVDHLDDVAHGPEQVAAVVEQLALRIEDDERSVCVHEIGLGVKPRLARAGAAADQNIQVAPVPPPIQPNGHILGQDLVVLRLPLRILPIDAPSLPPLRRPMLLLHPIIPARGQINSNAQRIGQKQNEDSLQTVLTELNMEWVANDSVEILHDSDQPISNKWGNQQGEPNNQKYSKGMNNNLL